VKFPLKLSTHVGNKKQVIYNENGKVKETELNWSKISLLRADSQGQHNTWDQNTLSNSELVLNMKSYICIIQYKEQRRVIYRPLKMKLKRDQSDTSYGYIFFIPSTMEVKVVKKHSAICEFHQLTSSTRNVW